MSEIELEKVDEKPWSFYLLKQNEVMDTEAAKKPKIKHPENVSIHKGFDTAVAKVKEYIAEGIPAPKIMVAEVTIEMDDKGTSIKASQIPWSVLFEKAFR